MYARLESLEPHPCCASAGKRVAVCCSVLQCVATMYARLVSLEPHYSTQYHTAARCNKLQHTVTATNCNTMYVRVESLEPHPCLRRGPSHMDVAAITV